MDTSNYSTNGTDYSQQSESVGQSMDHQEDGKGGRKPGERIYASKEQEDDKKLFVGGLAWDTTSESLQKHFSQFGEVLDCDIKKDRDTRKPRGFGFVLFANAESVGKALEVSDHKVDGKTVDPKVANPLKKPERKKKLFVGGIGSELKDDQITSYFTKYGNVVETEFPEDKNTNRRLGFAFVTFDTADEAQKVLEDNRFHFISGKRVEVSEAVSREERQQQKMRGGMGFRGKGRGGMYGGNQYGQGGFGGYGAGNYGGGGGGYGGGGYQGYGGGGYDQGYSQGGYGGAGGGYGSYGGEGYGGGGYGGGSGYGAGGGYGGGTYGYGGSGGGYD